MDSQLTIAPFYTPPPMIGVSRTFKQLEKKIHKAASSDINVLIQGESGTGKELVATHIHANSSRFNGPFIAINCGAIPEKLTESILFGHEKGAFTGATEKRIGKFQQAHNGTILLDEICSLSLDLQVKLLRVLQEQEVESIGSSQPSKVNFRLICATNRNLAKLVQEQQFREDLYYRINVFTITPPPLRTRKNDILSLANHFIQKASQKDLALPKKLHEDSQRLLKNYHWPGNIRQLENIIYRGMVNADSDLILPTDLQPLGPEESNHPSAQEGSSLLHHLSQQIKPLATIEEEYIRHVLDLSGGSITLAAKRLGIGRATLYRKLQAMNA